jgi:8-oxo-dGTP diphosphatase
MIEPVTDFCPRCGTRNNINPDDNGEVRAICPACAYVSYRDPKCAAVTFITRGDHLLLVQRKYDPGKGKWGLPGGFIEFGEDPQHTARREVYEETGLDVTLTGLLDVFYVENGVITIAYAGRATRGEPIAADDVQAAGWFTRSTLPTLVFLSTTTLCQRWQEGKL